MTTTVFYSWQSDLPNKTNRTFIEDALKKALKEISSDSAVEEAEREEVFELDKDTEGVPGIPPIADVIFKKISETDVFVPDLTFVGKTEGGRLLPNPNVLIEYGYALSTITYSRIVPVMNTAFGDANTETLPFDMRHLRRPVTYSLREDANEEERRQAKTELVKLLSRAIRLVLECHSTESERDTCSHVTTDYTIDPSNFLQPNEPLGVIDGTRRRPEQTLVLPNNEHIFLRIIPTMYVKEIASTQKAFEMLLESQILPLSDVTSATNRGRNRYGAFVCDRDNETVLAVTQLFCNRELWGINTDVIDKKSNMEWFNIDFGIIDCAKVEAAFVQTLSNYLLFCRDILQLSLPLSFIAGATGVEGYRITLGGSRRALGRILEQHVIYKGEITDYDTVANDILRPFFDHIWEEAGVKRPAH